MNRCVKYIKGYEKCYSVTEDGRVWSHYTERFLRPKLNQGYPIVVLQKPNTNITAENQTNRIRKWYLVHRLVAIAFVPNPQNLPIVNHKDGNPGNPHFSNLDWCTTAQNNHYSLYTIGKRPKRVLKIRELYASGVTQTILAKQFNMTKRNVCAIVTRETWKHI